jgi:hypothetical protein
MSKRLKVSACLSVGLAVLFYFFFQGSKHLPALAQVNAFANDPYDAVGSFGMQLALFTALLALLRAFRPFQSNKASDSQQLLLVRCALFSCLAIMITLIADLVAMVRHPAVWINQPAGYMLAAFVGGMALLTVIVSWPLLSWTQILRPPSTISIWIKPICTFIISLLILALYPEDWRQTLVGELLTVVVGTLFLFVPLWAFGTAIASAPDTSSEDLLDDIAAVYRWLKAQIRPFAIVCRPLERALNWPFVRSVSRWLNPRRHTWNIIILIGLVMGMALALAEAFGEGGGIHQIGRFAIVAAIFVGLECLAVILGYALFAEPLGLFRPNASEKSH